MKVLTNNQYYSEIADVIREQNRTNNTYKPQQMVRALKDLFYEEVEGVPPITFQGIGENLLDYRIEGASGGVGNKTNNLFDLKKSVAKKYINSNGDEATSLSPTPENTLNHSDYVSIESNVNYTFTCTTSQNYSLENTIALCWFDQNKNILSRNTMNVRGNINNYSITASSPSTAKYLIVNFIAYVDDAVFYLNEGTTTVFEPYGYKVPVVVNGKNLLQNTATTQTINGVTFTINDGSIICNGTSSAVTSFAISIKLNSNINYVLSGSPKNGSRETYRLDLRTISYSVYKNTADNGDGINFTIEENGTYLVCIRIAANYTCNNLTFYPMIRLASIEDDTYEPYIEPITTNIYLDEPIEENESISLSDTNTNIPTFRGTNVLTVETTVQPSNVYVKSRHESSHEAQIRQLYESVNAELTQYKAQYGELGGE